MAEPTKAGTPMHAYLHIDIKDSGQYIDSYPVSRHFTSELAAAIAKLLERTADDAWPAEGDATYSVFPSSVLCLKAIEELQARWPRLIASLKQSHGLGRAVPHNWPTFRAHGGATDDEVFSNRADNLQIWESIKSLQQQIACPPNGLVALEGFLSQLRFEQSGFRRTTAPVDVRVGKGHRPQYAWIKRSCIAYVNVVVESERLSPPVALSHKDVTLMVTSEYALLTAEGERIAVAGGIEASELPATCRLPELVAASFAVKNRARELDEAQGIQQEFDGLQVRLVAEPQIVGDSMQMLTSPASWAVYSVQVPYPESDDVRLSGSYVPDDYVLDALQRHAERLPEKHAATAFTSLIGPRNLVPLGLEGLVVTKDGYCLLRKRDPTSTTSPGYIDVSFSGHSRFEQSWGLCRPEPTRSFTTIDVGQWAAREFFRETGARISNQALESFTVLGLVQSRRTELQDLLGVVELGDTALGIASAIWINPRIRQHRATGLREGRWSLEMETDRRHALIAEFEAGLYIKHSPGAMELEVARTENFFVPFTPRDIAAFLIRQREEAEAADVPFNIKPHTCVALMDALALRFGWEHTLLHLGQEAVWQNHAPAM